LDGDLVSRCELFDDTDLDAAMARFDELSQVTPRLDNPAIQTWKQAAGAFNRRNLDEFFTIVHADGPYEDRRKGLRYEARRNEK
jgi:hypothetical protein